MSKLEQAGDKRTASPRSASSRPARTASSMVRARRTGTASPISRAMASAASPMTTAARPLARRGWCPAGARGLGARVAPAARLLDDELAGDVDVPSFAEGDDPPAPALRLRQASRVPMRHSRDVLRRLTLERVPLRRGVRLEA